MPAPAYTILTTCPPYGSRNVGDELIERRTAELIRKERGSCDYQALFREEPLADHLDTINRSRAILMPGFPVRDTPMYPGTYRLVEDLSRIQVPMIPIGANWNVYPGDEISRDGVRYSEATVDFLRHIASQVEAISYREHNVGRILHRHGIGDTVFTGDPAMFNPQFLGQPMRRPDKVRKLVFSPPLSPYYADQAEQVIDMLAELFPEAERICAFHLDDASNGTSARQENSAALRPEVAEKNRRIRERAESRGFAIWRLAGNLEGLHAYEACDLHVGYECHAHLYFLSARLPSVLIAEDARGYGFNQTFGVGGLTGFRRAAAGEQQQKSYTSGYCTTLREMSEAPPRLDVHLALRDLLEDELSTGFRRFAGMATFLDETYTQCMAPFLRSLP